MKTLNFLTILFLIVACSKTDEIICSQVVVNDGRIKSPQWLVNKVDSITALNPALSREPWVYTVNYEDEDYIVIWDTYKRTVIWDISSQTAITNNLLIYNCFGKKIDTNSDLYVDVRRSFQISSGTALLWKNPIDGDCNDVTIIDNWIRYPQWLVRQVDSINNLGFEYGRAEPDVYAVKYNEQDYILVRNYRSSLIVFLYNFYTCSGKPVPESLPGEGLYSDLIFYSEKTLLWSINMTWN